MRKQFVGIVVAIAFAASVLAVMPVSSASAAGYGGYCGAGTWNYVTNSGYVYNYRKAGTNNFCFLMINPYWGSQRMLSLTVTTSNTTKYDAGWWSYYAGPIVRTLGSGQCSSVYGMVSNTNGSNPATYYLYYCNSSPII